MGGLIDMEWKGCESIIRDLWVTMVGWVDVPYTSSDWGDFRRRHAIDISSWLRETSIYV